MDFPCLCLPPLLASHHVIAFHLIWTKICSLLIRPGLLYALGTVGTEPRAYDDFRDPWTCLKSQKKTNIVQHGFYEK